MFIMLMRSIHILKYFLKNGTACPLLIACLFPSTRTWVSFPVLHSQCHIRTDALTHLLSEKKNMSVEFYQRLSLHLWKWLYNIFFLLSSINWMTYLDFIVFNYPCISEIPFLLKKFFFFLYIFYCSNIG